MIGNGFIGNTFSGGIVPNATTFQNGVTISSGQLLLPDGPLTDPGLAFNNASGTGLSHLEVWDDTYGVDSLLLIAGGYRRAVVTNTGIDLPSDLYLSWNSRDLVLTRDAANTLALKKENNEQQFNIYSGNGAYGLIRSKQELVTTTAAATAATAAAFIPDGAIPLAISTYVQTAITIADLTGYNIGDGTDADRWGAIAGHAVGTKSNNSDWTATTVQAFIAAQAITLTAVGANFPAGGKIRVCMTYMLSSEPTS